MVANQPFVCDVDEEPGLVVLPAQKFFDSSNHPAGIIPPDSYRVVHSPVNVPHVCVVENCHPIVPNESKPDVNLLPGLFVLMRCIDEQRIDHRLEPVRFAPVRESSLPKPVRVNNFETLW